MAACSKKFRPLEEVGHHGALFELLVEKVDQGLQGCIEIFIAKINLVKPLYETAGPLLTTGKRHFNPVKE
jgi:hypothetical protein